MTILIVLLAANIMIAREGLGMIMIDQMIDIETMIGIDQMIEVEIVAVVLIEMMRGAKTVIPLLGISTPLPTMRIMMNSFVGRMKKPLLCAVVVKMMMIMSVRAFVIRMAIVTPVNVVERLCSAIDMDRQWEI